MKISLILLLCAIVTACGASGPVYKQHLASNANSAIVYVYRPSRAVNCCVAPKVYVEGEAQGTLKNGGYLVFELPPRKTTITVGDGAHGFEAQTLELSLEAGTSYYLKWVIGELSQLDMMAVGGMAVGRSERNYHLIKVSHEQAQGEISNLKNSK